MGLATSDRVYGSDDVCGFESEVGNGRAIVIASFSVLFFHFGLQGWFSEPPAVPRSVRPDGRAFAALLRLRFRR